MGTLKYILILFCNVLIAQKNVAILISKTDSIQIKKYENEKLYLTIYNKKNIEYNKKKVKVKRIDGIIDCNGCKNEHFTFIVRKINKYVEKKYTIPLADYIKNKNLFFYSGYFLINGEYYKNMGRVTQ